MRRFLARYSFVLVAALLLVGIAFTCVVLPSAYVHWIDDVMINEFGRMPIGAHDFDWNMNWYPNEIQNRQTSAPFYLGGLLLECGYLAFGELGPRLIVFVAFVLATFGLFFYINSKIGNRLIAILSAALFFSYPIIQVSVRGARVDAVAMLAVIAALCLLQWRPSQGNRGRILLFFLVGGLCSIGGFVWVSAALLGPLVLWEMLEFLKTNGCTAKERIGLIAVAMGGFLIFSAVILIPFYPILQDTFAALKMNFSTSAGRSKGHLMLKELVQCLLAPPGTFLVGFVLMLFCRRLVILAVGSWMLLALCAMTNIYPHRMIYFLPVVLVAFAIVYSQLRSSLGKVILFGILVLMTAISYARTCVFRNVCDLESRPLRDAAALKSVIERDIGRSRRIYNSAFSLYYIGRDLGWIQFRATGMSEIPPEALYPLVNCYICEAEGHSDALEQSLSQHGFKLVKRIALPTPSFSALGNLIHRTGRMTPILGEYLFYARE